MKSMLVQKGEVPPGWFWLRLQPCTAKKKVNHCDYVALKESQDFKHFYSLTCNLLFTRRYFIAFYLHFGKSMGVWVDWKHMVFPLECWERAVFTQHTWFLGRNKGYATGDTSNFIALVFSKLHLILLFQLTYSCQLQLSAPASDFQAS